MSDEPIYAKWYNSRGKVIYMTKTTFELCIKVHDYTELPDEDGLKTVRVVSDNI